MTVRNPEFRRNLWLQWTPGRALAVPLFLALVAAVTVTFSPGHAATALRTVFSSLALGLALCWGGVQATASVSDEVAGHTWDQQRLSSLTPWQMAWGKLLGATSLSWYAVLLAFGVALAAAVSQWRVASAVSLVASAVGALALQAWFMALRLHTLDTRREGAGRSPVFTVMGVLAVWQFAQWLALAVAARPRGGGAHLQWWGMALPLPAYALLMAGIALALGLLALWRSMGRQLLVRSVPWAWALGLGAAAFVIAGHAPVTATMPLVFFSALAGAAFTATYFDLFTQPETRTRWQALAWHARRREWLRLAQTLPLWAVSLAIVAACVPLVAAAGAALGGSADGPPAQAITTLVALALLRGLRDAGIVLFFSWGARRRSPVAAALLLWLATGLLLPLLLPAPLAVWVEPLWGARAAGLPALLGRAGGAAGAATLASGATPWVASALHLLVVAALLRWRWRAAPAREKRLTG